MEIILMVAPAFATPTCSLSDVQAAFLTSLPRIVRHARCYFRHVRCPHRKADCVSEVVSISWRWWLSLVERGKDPSCFVSVLATFAARAVRSGRRLCGQEWAKDAFSEQCQRRRGFAVGKLPDFSTLNVNPLAEALTDNTQSAVPDQVQFRLDFPAWLATHHQRNRSIVLEMAQGEKTGQLSRRFGLSPARVSQLRRELHDDWLRFTDVAEAA